MSTARHPARRISRKPAGNLVLTRIARRRDQDTVIIDVPPSDTPTRITIKLLETHMDKARIAFADDPPRAAQIDRLEIHKLKQQASVPQSVAQR